MSIINQEYNDRVRYILQNQHIDSVIVTEPVGWESDDKEYDRDDKYHGVFVKMSNNLKFIENGYETLKFIYEIGGINEDIRLVKEEKHPKTDIWTRVYDGYLDMSTYTEESKTISIKFNSGGIEAVLKAREKEAVELSRLTSLDGKVLDPLSINEVELDGRRIFLKSSWEYDEFEDEATLSVFSNDGNTRSQTCGLPLKLINQSHEEAQSVIPISKGDRDNGVTGMMVFAISENDRQIRIKGNNISFKTEISRSEVQWAWLSVCLTTYTNGSDYDLKDRKFLFRADTNTGNPDVTMYLWDIIGETVSFNFDETINIERGDSVALEFYIRADLQDFIFGGARFTTELSEIKGDLVLEEDSFFEKTNSKVILPHEACERLVEIYTGQKAFYSDVLGRTDIGYQVDGKASLNGLAHGLSIRGFTEEDELFKPLTTSLSDFMDSFSTTWNLGLGIEKIGFRERVRIEDLSYFYNRNTTIKLPNQVKKVKRTVSTKHFYSSILIGYEKGGNYDEAYGLDEYNGQSNFTTIISKLTNVFSKLSKYRADSYGLEFCRRKYKLRYSTEDSQYDKDIFKIDLKRGVTSVFNLRKWDDDFEQLPTGTFSPETAYNLRLTPFNCMLRHGWEISAGLTKYITDYVRYASSSASSRLKTKLIGSNEYAENGNIINSELPRARYVPEFVEFEHEVTFNISQQLQGETIILGKKIPNIYGCIEFINENNEKEKGFLMNLKPNGNGKWKVLKAN